MEDRRIMEGYLPSSARKQKVSTASSIKLKLPRCYPNRWQVESQNRNSPILVDFFIPILLSEAAELANRNKFWLTVWTQLAYHFNLRTAEPLEASSPPGCDEPTSLVGIFLFLRRGSDYIFTLLNYMKYLIGASVLALLLLRRTPSRFTGTSLYRVITQLIVHWWPKIVSDHLFKPRNWWR